MSRGRAWFFTKPKRFLSYTLRVLRSEACARRISSWLDLLGMALSHSGILGISDSSPTLAED